MATGNPFEKAQPAGGNKFDSVAQSSIGGFYKPENRAAVANGTFAAPTAPKVGGPALSSAGQLEGVQSQKTDLFGNPVMSDPNVRRNADQWTQRGFMGSNWGTLYKNARQRAEATKGSNIAQSQGQANQGMAAISDQMSPAQRAAIYAKYAQGAQSANAGIDNTTTDTFNQLYNQNYASDLQKRAAAGLAADKANNANYLGLVDSLNDGTMEGAQAYLRAKQQFVNPATGELQGGAKYLTDAEAEQNDYLKSLQDALSLGGTEGMNQYNALKAAHGAQQQETALTGLMPQLQDSVLALTDADTGNNAQALAVFGNLDPSMRQAAIESLGTKAGVVKNEIVNSTQGVNQIDKLVNNPWGADVVDNAQVINTNDGEVALKVMVGGVEQSFGPYSVDTIGRNPQLARFLKQLSDQGKVQVTKEEGDMWSADSYAGFDPSMNPEQAISMYSKLPRWGR